MKLIRPLLMICCMFLAGHLTAQDLHWTLFNYSPLNLNPAFTGAYEGSFRIGGIVRDQSPSTTNMTSAGSSVNSNTYFPTYNIYLDAPIIRGLRKQDWIGIGGSFYSDKSGDLGMGLGYILGSVAYHIGLDRKGKSVFTIGLQGGSGSFDVRDANMAILEENITANFMTPIPGGLTSDQASFFDLNAGVLLRSQVNKTTGLNVGLNFRHILPAKYSTLNKGSSAITLPQVIALHGQVDTKFNKKLLFTPAFMFQTAGNASEVQLQAMMGYLFNDKKNVVLNYGLGYRVGDAGQLLLGFDYGSFRVATSFDLTLSSAKEINNSIGGFELGISYIGRIYKDPAIKPVIFCPRF